MGLNQTLPRSSGAVACGGRRMAATRLGLPSRTNRCGPRHTPPTPPHKLQGRGCWVHRVQLGVGCAVHSCMELQRR